MNDKGPIVEVVDLDALKKAVVDASGGNINLDSIVRLNTDFIDIGDSYLLLNIKGFGAEEPDNILLLTKTTPLLVNNHQH